jgi:hypothetical protein
MSSVFGMKVSRKTSMVLQPREDVARYFELDDDSPYMLIVAPVLGSRGQAMTPTRLALEGIDKLNEPDATRRYIRTPPLPTRLRLFFG